MRSQSRTFTLARTRLAANLRQLRQERGLSQEKLADRAGCDRTYVGMLERKLGNPSLAVIAALAEALDVDLPRLLQ